MTEEASKENKVPKPPSSSSDEEEDAKGEADKPKSDVKAFWDKPSAMKSPGGRRGDKKKRVNFIVLKANKDKENKQ